MNLTVLDVWKQLKKRFHGGDVVTRLIFFNVGIYLLMQLLGVLLTLFANAPGELLRYFALPADVMQLVKLPWTVITYAFVHDGFFHLLFNMLCLYWFGTMYGQMYGKKEMLWLFLAGSLSGGLFYVLAYNIFPYFEPTLHSSCLVGASGAIMAIVFAVAFRVPNYSVRLFLIGSVRMKHLVLFLLFVDLMSLVGSNAGGHFAHIGGALLGMIQYGVSRSGLSLFSPFVRLQDWWQWCQKRASASVNNQERRYHRPLHKEQAAESVRTVRPSVEMERILDKLKVSGYTSLTSQEREVLFGNTNNK